MKKLLFVFTGSLTFLLFAQTLSAQTDKVIELTDESKIQLLLDNSASVADSKILDSFLVKRKEALVNFYGGNKANNIIYLKYLSRATLKKNKILIKAINKISTSFVVKQNGTEFDINGLNSIDYEKLRDCHECEVKISLIILEFKCADTIYNIPIIETIIKLNAVRQKK